MGVSKPGGGGVLDAHIKVPLFELDALESAEILQRMEYNSREVSSSVSCISV